jgi:hypothetical protein
MELSMNERIKELLAQCTQESIDGQFANPYVDQEKFAELIVRECADFVSNDRQNDDYGVFVANRIKQHFGVEECGTKN